MKAPPRRTHPAPPLYYPPAQTTPTPEVIQQISALVVTDFAQLTGAASNAQVPQAAVTQYDAAILASAALTGVPTTPTAAVGTNTTQVASTAFVLANAGSGGSAPARGDVVLNTASVADGVTDTGVVVLGKSSVLMHITVSQPCRVRLYSTAAYRTADAARRPGINPTGQPHGMMLDIVLITGGLTWDFAPLALVTNDDVPAVTNIYYAVQNMSGLTTALTVTLTRITTES